MEFLAGDDLVMMSFRGSPPSKGGSKCLFRVKNTARLCG